jgi:hypothetical protein
MGLVHDLDCDLHHDLDLVLRYFLLIPRSTLGSSPSATTTALIAMTSLMTLILPANSILTWIVDLEHGLFAHLAIAPRW